ncbi:hypothetical protein IDH28_02800, partial [Pelagibacterales bacterium SAG-MED31]|nr:hypothetical protein [Pelagibacterales bacterium SAG-MED31]
MKTLLTLFVLFFSSSVFAEDISDFELEGISIGDSLLDYVNIENINQETEYNSKDYYYLKNPKLFGEVYIRDAAGQYDSLSFFIKPNDPKFKIHLLRGNIIFNERRNECLNKKKEIVEGVESDLVNLEKRERNFNHAIDPSGKSKVFTTQFLFENGDKIS